MLRLSGVLTEGQSAHTAVRDRSDAAGLQVFGNGRGDLDDHPHRIGEEHPYRAKA
jgi:hypothetical protein